jgi:hypothetical protein
VRRHSGPNLFSQLSGHSINAGKLGVIIREDDEGDLGSRYLTENREAVDPLVIILDETSKGEHDSDDWQVPLG